MSESTSAGAPSQSSAPASALTQGSETGTTPPATDALGHPGNLLAEAVAEAAPEAPAEAETTTTEAEAAKPPVYEFTLPEGVAKDDPLLVQFTEAAAEAKLPAEAAQAVLDKLAPKLAEALQAPHKAWNATQTEWQAAIKADAEFGGAKLPQTLGSIAKLLDNPAYADPGLREAMSFTGAGNNPAVIRSLARMAAALNEGGMVVATKAAPAPKATADILYPSMAT